MQKIAPTSHYSQTCSNSPCCFVKTVQMNLIHNIPIWYLYNRAESWQKLAPTLITCMWWLYYTILYCILYTLLYCMYNTFYRICQDERVLSAFSGTKLSLNFFLKLLSFWSISLDNRAKCSSDKFHLKTLLWMWHQPKR